MRLFAGIKLNSLFHTKFGLQHRGPLAHSSRDFRYTLVIFALLLVLSSVCHYAYYLGVLETPEPSTASNYPDIKIAALEKLTLEYAQKQKAFDALVSGN